MLRRLMRNEVRYELKIWGLVELSEILEEPYGSIKIVEGPWADVAMGEDKYRHDLVIVNEKINIDSAFDIYNEQKFLDNIKYIAGIYKNGVLYAFTNWFQNINDHVPFIIGGYWSLPEDEFKYLIKNESQYAGGPIGYTGNFAQSLEMSKLEQGPTIVNINDFDIEEYVAQA